MFKYILLGIIQGVTEFFPVSSSAHLVIIGKVIGLAGEEVALSVVLHLGTALALFIFFFKDILMMLRNPRMLSLLTLVTLVTAVIAFCGKSFFESLFRLSLVAALALGVTGVVLIMVKKYEASRRKTFNLKDALVLGLAQGLAIIPGISRSGITISTLLYRGLDKEEALKLSFIASIPAVLGAALLEAREIGFALQGEMINLIIGFIFSFGTGILSLKLLRVILGKAKFHYFGYYCLLVSILALLLVR